MIAKPKQRNIAYRCPECGSSIIGLVGKFALSANLLRLKCGCQENEALDINITNEGKIRLSVPCIFCKQSHTFVVTEGIFFDRDKFLLNCPYSGMDIAFIGDEKTVEGELERTEREIRQLMASLEADELSDIQPQEMTDEEILPDAGVYDTLRFVVTDLSEEGRVRCLCKEGGKYDLRFTDEGIQAYCEVCGATHTFRSVTPSTAEEYLELSELELK